MIRPVCCDRQLKAKHPALPVQPQARDIKFAIIRDAIDSQPLLEVGRVLGKERQHTGWGAIPHHPCLAGPGTQSITVGPVDKISVLRETLSRSRVPNIAGTIVFVRLFMLGFDRLLTAAEADVNVSVIVSVTMRWSV